MTKFKNKETGQVIEENLIYYIDKLKKDKKYKEIEVEKTSSPKKIIKKEVENKPL